MKPVYLFLVFSSCTLPFAKGQEGAHEYIERNLAELSEANRAPTFEGYKTKAMAGDKEAQWHVGRMYSVGDRVEKNVVEGLAFLSLSNRDTGDIGDPTTLGMISNLLREMSPQQIEEAKKRLDQLVQQVK